MPKVLKKILLRNLVPRRKWHILKGDIVQILSGKDKGKQGRVKTVLHKKNSVIVEGANMVQKHVKRTPDSAGFVYNMEARIHYSNVALVDPVTGKPTRITYKYDENGKKVRVSKKSGAIIPKPEPWVKSRAKRPADPLKDTTPEDALEKTYREEELIELKDYYLKKLEIDYYNQLKIQYENEQKRKMLEEYKQKVFMYDVFERAKLKLQTAKAAEESTTEEIIEDLKTVKISDEVEVKIPKMKEQSKIARFEQYEEEVKAGLHKTASE